MNELDKETEQYVEMGLVPNASHAAKFPKFIQVVEECRENGYDLQTTPESLGDTYEEVITNLYILGDAGVAVKIIVEPGE